MKNEIKWEPTHKINHNNKIEEVMENENCLYSLDEWNAEIAADWELNETGELTFQGQIPLGKTSITPFRRIF